ncbi:hypothetical protein FGO68_gene15760 [Halteria grandinella]|uniref:Uncharacterized protein n=1 Tax=Halteria grandinella TaxID=5974 RepID=A0A8J8T318_HALGN|nr:hypothetical protein FGO68_gene15760 [Halteria grandinella]
MNFQVFALAQKLEFQLNSRLDSIEQREKCVGGEGPLQLDRREKLFKARFYQIIIKILKYLDKRKCSQNSTHYKTSASLQITFSLTNKQTKTFNQLAIKPISILIMKILMKMTSLTMSSLLTTIIQTNSQWKLDRLWRESHNSWQLRITSHLNMIIWTAQQQLLTLSRIHNPQLKPQNTQQANLKTQR